MRRATALWLMAMLAGQALATSSPASAANERVLYAFQGGSDGWGPDASLINVGGTLFGTTSGNSALLSGTVFAVNPATGAETVVYSFKGYPSDGYAPASPRQ